MPITNLFAFAIGGDVFGGEVLDMVSNTGLVAKIVLFVLLAFSLFSWAIILSK